MPRLCRFAGGDVIPAALLATAASNLGVHSSIQMLPKLQVCSQPMRHRSSAGFFALCLFSQSPLVFHHQSVTLICSEAASTSGRQGATPAGSAATSSGSGAASGGAAGSASAGGLPGSRIGGTSRLFENVKPMAAEEVAAATAEAPSEPGAAMRMLTTAGNTAFLGLLGAAAFFGYYTVRYDADTLQTVVQETHKEENQFVGSSVRHSATRYQPHNACASGSICRILHFTSAGLAPCDGVVSGATGVPANRNQEVPRPTL